MSLLHNIWTFIMMGLLVIFEADADSEYSPQRLAGFFLEAFDSTTDIPVYNFHDTSTKNDTLVYDWAIQMFVANRVTIYVLDNVLTLCEVEIYGDNFCSGQKFGLNCEHTCQCTDSKSSCMPSTGVCRTGGCTPGYKGKDCEEEKRCSAAPNITNGTWHNCQNEFRSVCTLVCEDGNEVKGNDTITCQANQEWTMPGVCSRKRCSTTTNVTHGTWHHCEDEIGSVCTLVCEHGYEVKGNDNITCQDNKEWTMPGVCSKKLCNTPQKVANGVWRFCNNDTCKLKCKGNYKLEGNETIQCQDNQNWTVPDYD
ncbi:P-selectin-like [Physella acuta]|uniref:P-selectin-like n=1 Tax=Physella acuta TaxID=109671 RepID=UPI0027DCFAD0|nr:P-selectin-like [Physella acuta]